MSHSSRTALSPERGFATTQWSVVLAASTDPATRAEALEKLCGSYWPPIYTYVRKRGYDLHQAQDLTQSFFAALLSRNGLENVRPEHGKFRAFLLASVNHFLANDYDRNQAAKRGGGQPVLSLDEMASEDDRLMKAAQDSPEKTLDRRWALMVLSRALQQLKAEFAAAGRETVFERLKRFLEEPAGAQDYATLASELRMNTGAVAVAVHRLRQRYRDLARREIARTVSNPGDVEGEVRHLLTVLCGHE